MRIPADPLERLGRGGHGAHGSTIQQAVRRLQSFAGITDSKAALDAVVNSVHCSPDYRRTVPVKRPPGAQRIALRLCHPT